MLLFMLVPMAVLRLTLLLTLVLLLMFRDSHSKQELEEFGYRGQRKSKFLRLRS